MNGYAMVKQKEGVSAPLSVYRLEEYCPAVEIGTSTPYTFSLQVPRSRRVTRDISEKL